MEKKWNWQKARIDFKPGENIYLDNIVNNFQKIESQLGFSRTRKALKWLFYLVLGYLILDLILNLFKIFV